MAKDEIHCEWQVTGMDCAGCAQKVRDAVGRLPGVQQVNVRLMSEKLTLTLDPSETPRERVEEVVRSLGYGLGAGAPAHHDHDGHDHDGHDHGAGDHEAQDHEGKDHGGHSAGGHGHDHGPLDTVWYRSAKGRILLATGAVLALAWGIGWLAPPVGDAAFVLACLLGLIPVARRAFAALRLGQPFTIEALMTIAAVGALAIGAAEEAAVVVFLFALGELLEGVAAGRARQGIRALSALVPTEALLEEGDTARTVPAATLAPGQVVRVRPGDRIPADGEIVEGLSGVDESPVTGESVPRLCGPGDAVHAGSINTEAALRIRVTRAAADNTIARIIRLVEEAEEARAPTERFIDRFSRWYMPAVVGAALLVVLVPPLAMGGDWGTWLYRGLALLLIGCPCALVISVPAAMASALATGARRGLLMKGGAVVETAARVRHVAFDKTGTLTRGTPVVTDVISADPAELLRIAAGVEAASSHPLGRAILAHAAAAGIAPPPATAARAIPGKGAVALIAGAEAMVSAPEAANAEVTALQAEGKTVVTVHHGGRMLGLVALRDEPRPDAAQAIAELRAMGLGATMLTGDNPRTAAAIASGLGLDYKAGMMPEDKLAAIRALSAEGGVMMIGDGINDAPALKQADVGVAMGSGTDVALETADAALLRDRVRDVPAQIRLARGAMANVRQNIAIALGLKGVFLVTTVLGITGLWPAILADTGATVLVTLNALRLLRFDPERG